jgi:CHRD domain
MRFIVFALAALVALSVFAVRTMQQPIEAAPVEFTVQLLHGNEIPPCTANIGGGATGKFTFNDDTNVLTWEITVTGLPPNTANKAHFHLGGPTVNGPIVPGYTLFDSAGGFSTITGQATLVLQDEQNLKNGDWYANVHSNDCAAGFARGQMIVPGTPGATRGAPTPPADNVGPPRTGDGGLADSDTGAGWIAAAVVAALVLVPGVWVLARKRA